MHGNKVACKSIESKAAMTWSGGQMSITHTRLISETKSARSKPGGCICISHQMEARPALSGNIWTSECRPRHELHYTAHTHTHTLPLLCMHWNISCMCEHPCDLSSKTEPLQILSVLMRMRVKPCVSAESWQRFPWAHLVHRQGAVPSPFVCERYLTSGLIQTQLRPIIKRIL